MNRLIIAVVVAVSFFVTTLAAANVLCFFEREHDSGGLYKICYYDCLGELAAITISSVRLCPLTIRQ